MSPALCTSLFRLIVFVAVESRQAAPLSSRRERNHQVCRREGGREGERAGAEVGSGQRRQARELHSALSGEEAAVGVRVVEEPCAMACFLSLSELEELQADVKALRQTIKG